MTPVLLDTHTWLWWRQDPGQLSAPALKLLRDPDQRICLSVASLWEVAIKLKLGKLQIDRPGLLFDPDYFRRERIDLLPIRLEHVERLVTLPQHHRAPFDRMLIAQAQVEGMTIITDDARLSHYGLPLIAAT